MLKNLNVILCAIVLSGCGIHPSYKLAPGKDFSTVTFSTKDHNGVVVGAPTAISICSNGKNFSAPFTLGTETFDPLDIFHPIKDKFKTIEMEAGRKTTIQYRNYNTATGYISVTTSCFANFTFTPEKGAEYFIWGSSTENQCWVNIDETKNGITRSLKSDYPHEKSCKLN